MLVQLLFKLFKSLIATIIDFKNHNNVTKPVYSVFVEVPYFINTLFSNAFTIYL